MVKHSKEFNIKRRERKSAELYYAWEQSGGGYPGAPESLSEFAERKKKKRKRKKIEW